MKYIRTGTPDDSVLDSLVELVPRDFALRSPWARLDFILKMIKSIQSDVVHEFVVKLTQRYQEQMQEDHVKSRGISVENEISHLIHLREHPSLAKWNLNYFLSELELDDESDWSTRLHVPERNQLRSFLMPQYHNLVAMIDTFGRNKAIEFNKTYQQRFVENYLSDAEDRFNTLEEWVEQGIKDEEDTKGWIRIWGQVENGSVVIRKDTCPWDDVLLDIEDRELKYLVCCYSDFFTIKGQNRNFVLTMEHTIVKGDPYCDVVIHDSRKKDTFEHPPKIFFDSLTADG